MDSPRASLSISFVIIGGSIAGLSSAYALCKAGHRAIVVETSDGISKVGGSLRCPPNMTRILKQWPGMLEMFQARATKCSGYGFRIWADTSERVGYMKFHEEIMSELGADFLMLQYDDLRRELTSLCLAADVVFEYKRNVVDVKSENGSVTVVLDDGKRLMGDVAVGADGHSSVVRSLVEESPSGSIHTVTGINISIPARCVKEDEDLRSLCNEKELTIWMGAGSSLIGTLDVTANVFDISVCSPVRLDVEDGDWYTEHSVGETIPSYRLSGCDPRLQKLIQQGYACCPSVQEVYEHDEIVGLNGTAVLVGDAAHSALIHGSHNSSMAVEDAVTLGRLFSRLSSRKQIPLLLNAYREIRHPRTSSTQDSEYNWFEQFTLPPGPLQDARDAGFNATLSPEFEDFANCEASEVIVSIWEQYIILFNHDADEEVDNWWSMWGSAVAALA
ncbi:hypothetical protein B0H15DRAFT_772087 [Mycena belliarum]|uniref:FAD-binding domain-containing protein n=1 Tax=Mycena belliarum TaxID=1033014 RepID=A0AAD6UDH3_9AGAR|nr:hypothetical protein B0H15DRAFT_772087 [Mycena belliae]